MRIYHFPWKNLLQIDKSKILVLISLNISVKKQVQHLTITEGGASLVPGKKEEQPIKYFEEYELTTRNLFKH
jgi:hypothetical protein